MKTKDQSIDTLRGIAILLVIAGYIIRGDLQNSHSLISSSLQWIYHFLLPIRMPLFTVISAYLYASSPATQETIKKLVTGKTRRIMVPFLAVSAIQYTFFSLFTDSQLPMSELYKIYLWPFDQFWFLWAIFWIFMAVGFLDSIKALETQKKWLGWLLVLSVAHIFLDPPKLFSVKGINYLFPFFLLGYGMCRFSKELFTSRMLKVYAATALIAYGVYMYFYGKPLADPIEKILALLISFSAVPLMFHFRPTVPLLAKIGYYAFGIHIFNKISTAFPRMAFEHFHIHNELLVFTTYLGCGIVFSIGIQIILEQFSFFRKYILGMKDTSKEDARKSILLAVPQSAKPVPAATSVFAPIGKG